MVNPCNLADLGVRAGRVDSETLLYGESRSIYRGLGYEYIDFKPYYYGEDIRYIDWRVSARYMTNPYEPNLYMREYISEKQVETLFIFDLHGSLNYWDKLASITYIATLMYSLARKLNDETHTIILHEGETIVIPSTRPEEVIEYLKKTICSLREIRGESNLGGIEKIITRYSKIRGFIVFTDYGVKPEYFSKIGWIARALNTSTGIIVATHKYELEAPIDTIVTVYSHTGKTVTNSLSIIYNEIKKHVNECRARITLSTKNYIEAQGLDHARENKIKTMRLYLNIRSRRYLYP